ncbi:hypothetical protein Tco_1450078, partial [Tanacetum coccineum]
ELMQRMLDFGLEVEVESTAALDLMRVLNSPCFMVKSWLVQDQTVLGKDYSNLLIADSLLKTIWFINAPCYGNEALASPKANGVIFIAVSTVVCSRTAGESSVAGTAGVVTIVGVYGHLRMHFRKASPFGLVSMYHKNRDRHCAYHRVEALVVDHLNQCTICCYAFDCRLWKL